MDKFNTCEAPEEDKGWSEFALNSTIHCEGQLGQNRRGGILDEWGNCSREHSPERNLGDYVKQSTAKVEGKPERGDSKIMSLAQQLICMTEGLIRILYLGNV